jgi:hypothetical protein
VVDIHEVRGSSPRIPTKLIFRLNNFVACGLAYLRRAGTHASVAWPWRRVLESENEFGQNLAVGADSFDEEFYISGAV